MCLIFSLINMCVSIWLLNFRVTVNAQFVILMYNCGLVSLNRKSLKSLLCSIAHR